MTNIEQLETGAIAGWGFPNFGITTKAHLFKPGRRKSVCGKYDRGTVIVFAPDDPTDRMPHVECKTCWERSR